MPALAATRTKMPSPTRDVKRVKSEGKIDHLVAASTIAPALYSTTDRRLNEQSALSITMFAIDST